MRRLLGPALAVALSTPALANDQATVRRFALVIGSNDGGPERVRLRYAGTDADAMATVLSELGGVRPEDLITLAEPTTHEITTAFDQLSGALLDARMRDQRTEVVVYYSGHSDEVGLLPEGKHYPYRSLRAELGRLDADVRVAIVDSCSSGSLIRTKGGVRRAPFLIDRSTAVRGEAFLTSSTADEASQESDRIGASFFTHHLVAGLRGAADGDGDGLVTLGEAYSYTFRETRESTENTRAGPQSPNYAIDLTGQGDYVMTDLRQPTSKLVLDDEIGGEIWLRRSDGTLLAEIDKLPGQNLSLSVPADTYKITLQGQPTRYSARIRVPQAETAFVNADDFQPMGEALATTVRGDTIVPPEANKPFGFQIVGRAGNSNERTRIEGASVHLLDGIDHSIKGLGLSFFGTRSRYGVTGAQIAFAYTASRGDLRGFQGSLLVNRVHGTMEGVQGAGLLNIVSGNSPKGTFGTQLAGLGNIASGGRKGAQLSTLFNINRGHLVGGQLTGGVNTAAGRVVGAQLALVGNVSKGDLIGAQWSLLFNNANGMRGAQLGMFNRGGAGIGAQLGLVNVASQLQGVQLGLINIAEDLDGEAIGLINIIRNGYHSVELGSDDLTPVSLGFKFGSRHLYTAFQIGMDPIEGVALSYGLGIGAHTSFFKDRLFLDVDVLARTLEAEPNRVSNTFQQGMIGSVRLTIGGDVAGPFGLWIGPAFHAVLPFSSDTELPVQSFMPGFSMGSGIVGHVGYQGGVRFRF